MEILSGKKLSLKAQEFKNQSNNSTTSNPIEKSSISHLPHDQKTQPVQTDIKPLEIQNQSLPSIRPTGKIKFMFALFLLTNLFINYDTGVIPASLIQIENELNVDYTQQAALGILMTRIILKTIRSLPLNTKN